MRDFLDPVYKKSSKIFQFEILFMSGRSKNHTLKGGTSPYSLSMGVPPRVDPARRHQNLPGPVPNRAHSYLRIGNLETNIEKSETIDWMEIIQTSSVEGKIFTKNEQPTKERIYGDLPPISNTLRRRRLLFAGHCLKAEDEINSSLLLWKKL